MDKNQRRRLRRLKSALQEAAPQFINIRNPTDEQDREFARLIMGSRKFTNMLRRFSPSWHRIITTEAQEKILKP